MGKGRKNGQLQLPNERVSRKLLMCAMAYLHDKHFLHACMYAVMVDFVGVIV